MKIWMLNQVFVKSIKRLIFSPFLNSIPVCTFVLNFEIWPRTMELRHPIVGQDAYVRFAHYKLSQRVEAMIFDVSKCFCSVIDNYQCADRCCALRCRPSNNMLDSELDEPISSSAAGDEHQQKY